MIRFLLILGLCLSLLETSDSQVSPSTNISLLTCGPGDDFSSLFGHTALRLSDPYRNIDVVFNYGLFDPSDPIDFLINFVKGNTQYIVGYYNYDSFLRAYAAENRWVKEQNLNLTTDQIQVIEGFLRNNVRPENRQYLYNFYYDNCSTRVKELLEQHLPAYGYVDAPIKTTTYRKLTHEYTVGRDWTAFGIDLIIASPGDEEVDHHGQMFLPDYVMLYMNRFKDESGKSIVSNTHYVLTMGTDPPRSWWITPLVLFSILLCLEVLLFFSKNLWNSKWVRYYDTIWYVLVSLASGLLLFMVTTLHTACHYNYNLLWLSPLFIPFTALQLSNNQKWVKWIGYATIGMLVITIAGWTMWPQVLPSVGLLIAVTLVFKIVRRLSISSEKSYGSSK